MAVYISRRNKVEGRAGHEAPPVFLCNVRAWLEYTFYKAFGDVDADFKQRRCYNNIICFVENDELHFAQDFVG